MADPRYRAVTTMLGSRVFEGDWLVARCESSEKHSAAETAERIAAALNEMETRDGHD